MTVFSLEQLEKSGKKVKAYNDEDNILVMEDQKTRTYYSPYGKNWKIIQTQELLTNKKETMLKLNHGFFIDADDISLVLYEEVERTATQDHVKKEGKPSYKKGDKYKDFHAISYHTNIGNALIAYLNIRVNRKIENEDIDMESLIAFIRETKQEILQITEL